MNAADVKETLTTNDIVDLLHELHADPIRRGNEVHCRTICHSGHKHKLIYFAESKTFSCFTDSCGFGFDIFILVEKVYNIDFPQAFKYVCGKFNISIDGGSYNSPDTVDTSFIRKFKQKKEPTIYKELSTNLLRGYYDLYHKSWVEDGIGMKTMRKFGVMYSIMENKIIIPHYSIDGKLIGVRGRALNQDEIDMGRKYMPVYHPKGGVLKHMTGGNIYGLNVTKKDIIRHKTILLFESEKGPQQLDTMLPEMSIGGGISGSALSWEQVNIMRKLGVEHVVIGVDKEWQGKEEEKFYKQKIKSGMIDKLLPDFRVSILWDRDDILDLKDSPTDKGVEAFLHLWRNKITI